MESNPSFSLVFAGSTPSLPSKNSTRQSIFTSRFTLNFDIWRLPLGDFSPPNTYFQYFPPHRLLQSKSSSRNSLFYPTEVNVSRWAGRCPHNPNTVSHSPVKMCSEECRSVSPSPPHPLLAVANASRRALDAQKLLSNLNKGETVAAAGRTCATCCRASTVDPPNLLHHPPSPFGFPCLTLDIPARPHPHPIPHVYPVSQHDRLC